MFRFTIRDLLWLTMVVAVACGWWIEHRKFEAFRKGGIMFYLKPPAATK